MAVPDPVRAAAATRVSSFQSKNNAFGPKPHFEKNLKRPVSENKTPALNYGRFYETRGPRSLRNPSARSGRGEGRYEDERIA